MLGIFSTYSGTGLAGQSNGFIYLCSIIRMTSHASHNFLRSLKTSVKFMICVMMMFA